jgi:hypothetical protein
MDERGGGDTVAGKWALDDVNWTAISKQHGSRNQDQCRIKWYKTMTPEMKDRGEWGAGEDKKLIKALWESGAQEGWEVDWGKVRRKDK